MLHRLSAAVRKWDSEFRKLPDWPRRYGLAMAALFAATAISAILMRTVGRKASLVYALLFELLIMGAAWLGYGPGLLVCALVTFVIPGILMPARASHVDFGRFGLLVVISLLISRISTSKRSTEATLRRSAEDLEERVQERTAELRRNEQRLREQAQLLDLAQDAILSKDDAGRIRYWSRGAEQMYGWTAEEAVGKISHELLKTVFPEPLSDIAARVHSHGSWQGEITQARHDGTCIVVMSRWALCPGPDGGPPGSLEINDDITDRRRVEEQLRHTQKMESIGLLAGGVAHDFNNLLTVITGYAEMLIGKMPPGSSTYDCLLEIRAAAERAAGLTQQLLSFSRKQVLQPAVVNLNHVVTDIRKMLVRLIGEDIEVVTRLDPALGNVTADAGQLQQIVVNLAVNARDAMPHGGFLIVETSEITFTEPYRITHPEVQLGPHVTLTVTDSGIGMTREVQERLFEPFFTTKPKGSGTGLGLATVYGMVKQAGGWIWVYSEVGHGSTFKIYLPRTSSAVAEIAATCESDLNGHETVLVVEDQIEVRRLAVAALQLYGYHVLQAPDGNAALLICEQFAGTIDLLLTDVIMPGMTGRDLADRVSQRRPNTRILFVSGYPESAISYRGVLQSEVAYLQKPFTPQSLAQKVRSTLGLRRAGSRGNQAAQAGTAASGNDTP
jgi:two-component system, cell cycle sensor histidine kinase and response regulator CckA